MWWATIPVKMTMPSTLEMRFSVTGDVDVFAEGAEYVPHIVDLVRQPVEFLSQILDAPTAVFFNNQYVIILSPRRYRHLPQRQGQNSCHNKALLHYILLIK
jgi:hypothetical protein